MSIGLELILGMCVRVYGDEACCRVVLVPIREQRAMETRVILIESIVLESSIMVLVRSHR